MKSYYDIAISDYRFLQDSIDAGFKHYNQMSISCQQIAEKLLKEIISFAYVNEDRESLLKTHNLKKLYKAIRSMVGSFELSIGDLADLSDYYFDARYPGDDYIDVDEESFLRCYKTMLTVKEEVDKLLKDK